MLCYKGEIKICELEKVFRYDTYSSQKSGRTGTLFVTNFKVSFVTLKLDVSAEYVVRSNAWYFVISSLRLMSIETIVCHLLE